MKSFRRNDGSDEPPGPGRNSARDFHGEKLSNETHASTTDPDARLYKKAKGQAAKLCHLGHVVMENRSCLEHVQPDWNRSHAKMGVPKHPRGTVRRSPVSVTGGADALAAWQILFAGSS
jgi:hypothetical protein